MVSPSEGRGTKRRSMGARTSTGKRFQTPPADLGDRGLHDAVHGDVGAVSSDAKMHAVEAPRAVLERRPQSGGIVDGQAFPWEIRNPDDHVSRFLLSVCQKKSFPANRASISTGPHQVKAFGPSI